MADSIIIETVGLEKRYKNNPQLQVDVWTERDFGTQESDQISSILSIVAFVVGAIFGALNTMYSAVSTRSSAVLAER